MGKLKPTCIAVTEDGSQLYALASGYDTSITFGDPGSDTRYILLKSDTRPASLQETSWNEVRLVQKIEPQYSERHELEHRGVCSLIHGRLHHPGRLRHLAKHAALGGRKCLANKPSRD